MWWSPLASVHMYSLTLPPSTIRIYIDFWYYTAFSIVSKCTHAVGMGSYNLMGSNYSASYREWDFFYLIIFFSSLKIKLKIEMLLISNLSICFSLFRNSFSYDDWPMIEEKTREEIKKNTREISKSMLNELLPK